MWKKAKFLLFGSMAAALLAVPCFALPQQVVPGGEAVGLLLQTDGVYIADFSCDDVCPAKAAGLQIGDRITAIDSQSVWSIEQIPALIEKKNGAPVNVEVDRSGTRLVRSVQPIRSDGAWKLGILGKDQIAGIGTLTYYDPERGRFGALGHAVSSGQEAAQLRSGSVAAVQIVEVRRGERGAPGALIGTPEPEITLGSVERNLPQGVFGSLDAPPSKAALCPVASENEVRTGEAIILCTVQGDEVRAYRVEITAFHARDNANRNLQFKVTDPALLEATGGIVQGISGAPILQDGRLIGAVTHVLVDRPEQGYGIFIGNMLAADEALPLAA